MCNIAPVIMSYLRVQMVSIIDVVDRYVPTREDMIRRDRWLYTLGPKMTRADLLGVKSKHGYDVLPLTRVWDWVNIPYQYPLTARDWWIVIQGMPDSNLKDDFLLALTYGVEYHTAPDYEEMAIDSMQYDNGTLVFNPYLDMFLIVSP